MAAKYVTKVKPGEITGMFNIIRDSGDLRVFDNQDSTSTYVIDGDIMGISIRAQFVGKIRYATVDLMFSTSNWTLMVTDVGIKSFHTPMNTIDLYIRQETITASTVSGNVDRFLADMVMIKMLGLDDTI